MTFIATPNVAKGVLEGSFGATPIVNTLWFLKSSNWDSNDLENLAIGLDNWYIATLQTDMVSAYNLDRIITYDMSSEFGPKWERVVDVAGAVAQPSGSGQDVLTVKFGTNNRGRSGRGGNRVSPIADIDLNGNVIGASWIVEVVADYQALNTYIGVTNPGATHVVVSFQVGGVPRAEGLPQSVISYSSVTTRPRTQKSRRSPD